MTDSLILYCFIIFLSANFSLSLSTTTALRIFPSFSTVFSSELTTSIFILSSVKFGSFRISLRNVYYLQYKQYLENINGGISPALCTVLSSPRLPHRGVCSETLFYLLHLPLLSPVAGYYRSV